MGIFSFFRKKKDIDRQLYQLFGPDTGVDVAFENNDGNHIITRAMIYKNNYLTDNMLISQTTPRTRPEFEYRKMWITSLVKGEDKSKIRFGMDCQILKFIKNYKGPRGRRENILKLSYTLPVKQINLRESFRFRPGTNYDMHAKIALDGKIYSSGEDFDFQDISIQGTGLQIPNDGKLVKSLLRSDRKKKIKTRITLLDTSIEEKKWSFNVKAGVVWKKNTTNKPHSFIGARFIRLASGAEKILTQYIHNGQIFRMQKRRADMLRHY